MRLGFLNEDQQFATFKCSLKSKKKRHLQQIINNFYFILIKN